MRPKPAAGNSREAKHSAYWSRAFQLCVVGLAVIYPSVCNTALRLLGMHASICYCLGVLHAVERPIGNAAAGHGGIVSVGDSQCAAVAIKTHCAMPVLTHPQRH